MVGSNRNFSEHPAEESINDIYQSSLQYGTTEVLPCLISSSHENILEGIEAIKNYRAKYNNGVLGMHLEEPFINPKNGGQWPARHVNLTLNGRNLIYTW